jgi:pimeloyl-ACP methyl ester carboxylesterase
LQLDMLADQMVATAVQAGVEKFTVLGYSMGCAVALRAATRHPDRVMALILTAGFAQLDSVSRLKIQILRNLGDRGNQDVSAQLMISFAVGRQCVNSMSEEQLEELVELMASVIAPGAAEQADLTTRIDVRADLPKVSVPTLVINMTDDQLVPPYLGKALADGIPGAQIAELDCGHLPIDRGPEWLRLIQSFLAAVSTI